MENLTRAQIIAQSVFPRLAADRFREEGQYRETIEQLVQKGVGGFCVMSGTPAQVAGVIAELQQQAPRPLLFAADFEWGLPMRLEGGTPFPNAYALSVANDEPLTFRVAECIAREAQAIGIRWIFAPVTDVLLEPQNVVIGVRSFGANVQTVVRHSVPFLQGIQHHQLLACAKHFPGHGATTTDSHHHLPIVRQTLQELSSNELMSFAAAVQYGVRSVMVGHVAYPLLEPDEAIVPASLSPTIVRHLLREQLGYDHLVVTDALDMAAITEWGTVAAAIVQAKQAGNDVLLMPPDPMEAITVLQTAVEDGVVDFASFEATLERLEAARQYVGLLGEPPVEPQLAVEEHRRVALVAAQRALRWADDRKPDCLPLDRWEEIAVLAFVDNDPDMGYATYAFQYIPQFYDRECHVGYLDHTITDEDITKLQDHLLTSETQVFLIFATHRAQALLQHRERIAAVVQAFRQDRPAIAVIFGNPVMGEQLPVDGILYAYSFTEPSIVTALASLFEVEQVKSNKTGESK